MAAHSAAAIRRDYLRLYRAGLQAVRYSKPARFYLRDILRHAFRSSPRNAYDAQRVANTVQFLQNAAATSGVEHKVVRNILMMAYWRRRSHPTRALNPDKNTPRDLLPTIRKQTYGMAEDTLKMLNATTNMDLRLGI